MNTKFEIIVVGGGHAGIEASNICSKLGIKTLLITNSIDTIGKISCNPSIGGIGKSQIVKEISYIGGIMPEISDKCGINFKKLNLSKGPAVQSTRIQIDKIKYSLKIKKKIFENKNLKILQQEVSDIKKKNDGYEIKTRDEIYFFCNSLILTSGTFINCRTYIGNKKKNDSRDNEKFIFETTKKIDSLLKGRKTFKTGTPPRVDKKSLNYDLLREVKSDLNEPFFVKRNKEKKKKCCWFTKTNEKTREIIEKNIEKSSMFNGLINNPGPRYCPSIEDKMIRFPKNRKHNIFVERESYMTNEMYLSGLSTSFDEKIQYEFLKSIKGFENVEITRFGYAIEYDFFDPKNLSKTLECKNHKGLFLAGQINGTTGYEEAACQGIVAGINSYRFVREESPILFDKKKTYIGVLIEDITKRGIDEPYRMFTSRAKNRILMREDNTNYRLNKFLYKKKIISKSKFYKTLREKKISKRIIDHIDKKKKIKSMIINNNFDPVFFFKKYIFKKKKIKERIIRFCFSEIKYGSFLKKRKKKIKIDEKKKIDFSSINGIPNEIIEKIKKKKITNLKQLKKIKTITPACIFAVKMFLKKKI
ncbi:tRNA uridine 5-carboxymethylaminomethyl modification enzyme [Candidatus Vidania fulgoroideae]|nr:tRNA uridine 5-carboxymethylaminomethyl modification enzyme [Candidatus Vidania fulgoroideae]